MDEGVIFVIPSLKQLFSLRFFVWWFYIRPLECSVSFMSDMSMSALIGANNIPLLQPTDNIYLLHPSTIWWRPNFLISKESNLGPFNEEFSALTNRSGTTISFYNNSNLAKIFKQYWNYPTVKLFDFETVRLWNCLTWVHFFKTVLNIFQKIPCFKNNFHLFLYQRLNT